MGYINNYYIFIEEETVTRGVDVSIHAVEQGLDITDNVKRKPIVISVTGEIVGENASTILSNIVALHQGGKFVKYSGRNIINKALITNFETGHPNTIHGGCSFTMEITETRIAKNAYIPPTVRVRDVNINKVTKSGTQQVQNNTTEKHHTVKKGDTLWAIAKSYYGSGAQYTKIVEANKLQNANALSVGQVLLIP